MLEKVHHLDKVKHFEDYIVCILIIVPTVIHQQHLGINKVVLYCIIHHTLFGI